MTTPPNPPNPNTALGAVTPGDRAKLRLMNYTDAEIDQLSPTDASTILGAQPGVSRVSPVPAFPDLITRYGVVVPNPKSVHNIEIAIKRQHVELAYNEFDDRVYVTLRRQNGTTRTEVLDDDLENRMLLNTQKYFDFLPTTELFNRVIRNEAVEHSFHPVREYLLSLRWDGTVRLDTWLTTYCGAQDTPFVRAVGALALIAAVRRVRQPGCKFDEILILESPQGLDKSTGLEALCHDSGWFTSSLRLTMSEKEVIEQTTGKWIVEIPELSGISGAEVEHLKALLSRGTDSSRLAYGRNRVDRPRQFVLFGTTNDTEYLRDMTGNRRFWPVAVQRLDVERIRRDRDQLWAEAVAQEATGGSIRLPEALWQAAADEQELRRVRDPWEDTLLKVLAGKTRIPATELYAHVGKWEKATKSDGMRLRQVMERLGWRRMTVTDSKGNVVNGYGKVP